MTAFLEKFKTLKNRWSISPILGKNEFSQKRGLCQFLDFTIIYHHTKKKQKKLMCSYREKLLPNRQTGR